MEQFDEKLLEFLNYGLDPGEKKHHAIILKFEDAIKRGLMLPGSKFPTQKTVENFFNISEKISIAIWKELKARGLIKTRTSLGTIVADIAYINAYGTFQEENVPDPNNPRIVMDQLPLTDQIGYKGDFSIILRKTMAGLSQLTYSERNSTTIMAFTVRCRNTINIRLNSSFSEREVLYSQDSHFQIFTLVQIYLSNDVFVMATPVPDLVTSAVHEAGKQMVTIGSDKTGINTDELEQVCKEHEVGIVCISSRAPFPSDCIISNKKMDHLLELQKTYGFLIFFYDTYPVPDALHQRIYKEMGTNPNMIYLGPLSLLDASLYSISILVAREAKMKKIRKKFIGHGVLAEPKLVYAIIHLHMKGQIDWYERRDYLAIKSVYHTVVQALKASGLWKEEGLYSAIGWLCYLEPKVGALPPNAFELLSNENIFVFDPKKFDCGPEFKKGIAISLGTKKIEKEVLKDIEKINSILQKDYKRNTHQ